MGHVGKPYDPAMANDNKHLQVMADVLRDVWQLAERWKRDDDTEAMASEIFTAYSVLIAWEDECGMPHTVSGS